MTPTMTVPPRHVIAHEHRWNAASVFESDAAWQAEYERVEQTLPDIGKFKGRLAESPAILLQALQAIDDLNYHTYKVLVYAGMEHQVDTTNQTSAALFSQAQGLASRALAAASFLDPELLAIGKAALEQWMQQAPRLAIYSHYIDNLFRKQAHVRSAEVEEVLGMLADPFGGASTIHNVLTAADFQFEPAAARDGSKVPLTQGSYHEALASPDREVRRSAWENYTDLYLAYKNTLANTLATSIKQNVLNMHARRFDSTLDAALFPDNIPVAVFHNLIETFRKNLPTWQRYWRLRRKALDVGELHPYDIWAPLTHDKTPVRYQEAVEWICAGLQPMGAEYVDVVRRGCLEDRWVDIYPNVGKTQGAFSWGAPGTHPFILMSYNDNVLSMSTLAHELGHSMHSYLTWETQPQVYSGYSLFAAEVASNFHQAMVRAHLLKTNADPTFQINLIEEALNNFHRYFFIMPTLARFELETHQRAERGEGLTGDALIEVMADLFTEAYGGEMHVDRPRVGITWATFGHLYADYYVFQYATGIAAANALSKRILDGAPNAAEAYRTFLKAGSSMYPLDALKMAGVDLTTPQPVEEAFAVLAGLVDKLEDLLGQGDKSKSDGHSFRHA